MPPFMPKRRPWRWVTRDKGTEYEDTVSIWLGTQRPKSLKWNGIKWAGPTDDDIFDYEQGGASAGHSLDIHEQDFRDMYGLHIERSTVQRILFRGEVIPNHTIAKHIKKAKGKK